MPHPSKRPKLPQVEPQGYRGEDIATHANPVEFMTGVTGWVNPRNHFAVMEVGFEADPDKRDPQWEMDMSAPMGGPTSPDWKRFMKRDWSVRSGDPVFPEFINRPKEGASLSHVIHPADIPSWWSKRRGVDPGGVNPFAVGWWACSPEGIPICYRELYVENTYQVKIETPAGWLISLDAMKWLIWDRSRGDEYERTVIDPSSKSRSLLAFGPENPRATVLQALNEKPYPLEADPHKRMGSEYLEIERIRSNFMRRRHFSKLSDETLEVLGLPVQEQGYELFGGYIMTHCQNHIREITGLRWDEVDDPEVNRPETIVDKDNHTTDAMRYALGAEWDPKKRINRHTLTDQRHVRARSAQRDLEKAGEALAKGQQDQLGYGDVLEEV